MAYGDAGDQLGILAQFLLRAAETPCLQLLEQCWCLLRVAINVSLVAVHPQIVPPRRNTSSSHGPEALAGQVHTANQLPLLRARTL